ncbi:hypothetical protein HYPSUDRAFT_816121 [Hypholoma sublateritium FD-334 SS-4]|uniref:Uncharacterized protein n=1 Tax=Hypholoma sublateritium (strain FD-334 SS-4) TaxID=945553 RepID=A0A0D2MAC5_HYPSF|nr:hypothetical protein HYPSUDRAFT_816121 [Hypholoma sublateritium FD-334 SS-4]
MFRLRRCLTTTRRCSTFLAASPTSKNFLPYLYRTPEPRAPCTRPARLFAINGRLVQRRAVCHASSRTSRPPRTDTRRLTRPRVHPRLDQHRTAAHPDRWTVLCVQGTPDGDTLARVCLSVDAPESSCARTLRRSRLLARLLPLRSDCTEVDKCRLQVVITTQCVCATLTLYVPRFLHSHLTSFCTVTSYIHLYHAH